MTIAHALPRSAKILDEAGTFANGPGVIDWAASGTLMYLIDPDVSGLARAMAENENIRSQPLDVHLAIPLLRNGDLPYQSYMHGSPVNAAEGAAATVTSYPLAVMLKNYYGGQRLGRCEGIASGTDTVITLEDGTNVNIGDFGWIKDTSTGLGYFRRIIDKTGDDVTLDTPLPFTPDAGGADVMHAVIAHYFDQDVITQHDHADHETMAMVVVGAHAQDAWEVVGCKLNMTIPPIEAGVPSRLAWTALATIFAPITKPTLTGTPLGEPGSVPSIGTGTSLLMADKGDPLAAQSARGVITPQTGITYDRVKGVPGEEGVLGHVAQESTFGAIGVEMRVPFTEQWWTDFNAQTQKHALIQVGNTIASKPWGLYYPQLEIHVQPTRVPEQGLISSDLKLRARQNQDDPGALAGAALQLWRSPMVHLSVA